MKCCLKNLKKQIKFYLVISIVLELNNKEQVKITELNINKIKLNNCPTITPLGSTFDLKHSEGSLSKSTVFYGCLEKNGSLMVVESEVEYPSLLVYNMANLEITNYEYITNYKANMYINFYVTDAVIKSKKNQ